jgi:hypothetical protein
LHVPDVDLTVRVPEEDVGITVVIEVTCPEGLVLAVPRRDCLARA